jgi:hypothetical protein
MRTRDWTTIWEQAVRMRGQAVAAVSLQKAI